MNIHPNKQFFQVAGARDQTTDPWITRPVLYPYTKGTQVYKGFDPIAGVYACYAIKV